MSDKDDNSTMMDDVRAAIEETSKVDEPVAERSSDRDELGRFKSKEQAVAPVVDESVAPPVEDKKPPTAKEEAQKTLADSSEGAGKWDANRAPNTWKPAVREKWATLPEDIRSEIVRREEASVLGVAKIHEQYAPYKALAGALDTYIQEARQFGTPPESHIAATMATERVLRTAPMPDKFNALLQIADTYGIPLREIVNTSVGAEVLAAPKQSTAQLPPEIMQEFAAMREWRASMENEKVSSEVSRFGAEPTREFFGDVRSLMADLIESGKANGLEDAYDMAVWMHPDVREVLIQRRTAGTVDTDRVSRQVAAKAASVKPTRTVTVDATDEDEDLRSAVLKSVARLSGRT